MLKSKKLVSHTKVGPDKEGYTNSRNSHVVSEKELEAWHTLFGEGTLLHVMNVLNSTWVDIHYEVVFVRKHLMNLKRISL